MENNIIDRKEQEPHDLKFVPLWVSKSLFSFDVLKVMHWCFPFNCTSMHVLLLHISPSNSLILIDKQTQKCKISAVKSKYTQDSISVFQLRTKDARPQRLDMDRIFLSSRHQHKQLTSLSHVFALYNMWTCWLTL